MAVDADYFPVEVRLDVMPGVILAAKKQLGVAETDELAVCLRNSSAVVDAAELEFFAREQGIAADALNPRLTRAGQLVVALNQIHAVAGFCHAACYPADFSRDHVAKDVIRVVTNLHLSVVATLHRAVVAVKNSTFAVASVGCFRESEAWVANRVEDRTLPPADVKQHPHQVAHAKPLQVAHAVNLRVAVAAELVCWIGYVTESQIVATMIAAPRIQTLDVAAAVVVRSPRPR